MSEEIETRFQVSAKRVYISAKYQDAMCVLQWDHGSADTIKVLVANLPLLLRNGMAELEVQAAIRNIDAEHRQLFPNLEDDGD